MNQEEDGGLWAIVVQTGHAIAKILRILDCLSRLHIEDVDHNPDLLKDCGSLHGKIRVHERVLSSAVPEVEDKVAEKTDVILFDIYGRAKTSGEGGWVI